MKNNTTLFGYESISDFVSTALGLASFKTNTIMATIAAITGFLTGYVYDSAQAVYFMLFALLCDGVTGVWLSIKNKKFSSARLPRVLIIMVFYCLLLSLGWNAAKYNMIFTFLPGLIFGGLITTILVSVTENIYHLGYLPKSIFDILKQRLRLNKLLDTETEQTKQTENQNKENI